MLLMKILPYGKIQKDVAFHVEPSVVGQDTNIEDIIQPKNLKRDTE